MPKILVIIVLGVVIAIGGTYFLVLKTTKKANPIQQSVIQNQNSPNPIPTSSQTSFVSKELLTALEQTYGPLVDSSKVGELKISTTTLNYPYTFSFEGDGFTPNSETFVALNIPGNQNLNIQDVIADKNGHISGEYKLSKPQAGNYLISAVDAEKIKNELNIASKSGIISQPATYMAGAILSIK